MFARISAITARHGGGVSHVDRAIDHGRAGAFDASELTADLALGQELSCFLADFLQWPAAVRPFQQGSFDLGLFMNSRQPVGLGGGGEVRPRRTSLGPKASARATATSAVTPRAPPLITTRSPRSTADHSAFSHGRVDHGLELHNGATLGRQGDFGRTTMEQLIHDQVGGASMASRSPGRDRRPCNGRPATRGRPSWPFPRQRRLRARFRTEPRQPERTFKSRHGQKGRTASCGGLFEGGPAVRIVRNASLTNASSAGASGASTINPAEPLVRYRARLILRAGSPDNKGLAFSQGRADRVGQR